MSNNSIFRNILNLHSYIFNNKWKILFLVFGVLIAYALGKKFGLKNENFDDTKNSDTIKSEDNAIEKKNTEEFHSVDEQNQKDDMINKAIDRGVKNVKAQPIITETNKKNKLKKIDLKQYVHKSLVPDIDDYVNKDDVARHYISKKLLDKKYMLKENCKPQDIDYSKYISRDDLQNYYISKSILDKKYIKKDDCDCYVDSAAQSDTEVSQDTYSNDDEVIQKVEVRHRKKIIEVPEIVYKKVKVEVEEPSLEVEEPSLEVETPPIIIKKSPKRLPILKKKSSIILKPSPKKKKKSKCNSPRLLKQQSILDKNKLDMNDNFSKVDDDYTYCNAKSCVVNGFPNGLSVSES
jgi:hypothetical protein